MIKRICLVAAVLFCAQAARADKYPETNDRQHFPDKEHFAKPGGNARRSSNLSYHGGDVLNSARVVTIFWGSYWSSGTGATEASHIVAFFNQFGTSSHWTAITQYTDSGGAIHTTSLGNVSWNDTSAPPTNVTDAAVQGEVKKYLSAHGLTADASTIYEVFIPPTSYSSDGNSTSCGGPSLAYCAYHGHFSSGGDVKYAIIPYPSCGGCQSAGFSAAQNIDHFSCHETREAVTDADLNAWYDRSGNEADDKCAWSPAPFTEGGYGYQYEWSNSAGGCVK